ncbi:hypothetical protein HYT24_03540 [Candidatus Pacearchaeota archaeon]|nr:hypothetical protein [Candidatus Pacearchaeota archaeon]
MKDITFMINVDPNKFGNLLRDVGLVLSTPINFLPGFDNTNTIHIKRTVTVIGSYPESTVYLVSDTGIRHEKDEELIGMKDYTQIYVEKLRDKSR